MKGLGGGQGRNVMDELLIREDLRDRIQDSGRHWSPLEVRSWGNKLWRDARVNFLH